MKQHFGKWRMFYAFGTLIAAATMLSGCTLAQDEDARLKLAVQYTTIKLIERSDKIDGARVQEGVQHAREVVERDEAVSIALLSQQVRGVIRWEQLDAADQLLLNAVLLELETYLAKRIGDGLLDVDAKVAIKTLLDWIEVAAAMGG